MKTILVVDDDPGIILLITTILNRKLYQCLAAADGAEAQQILRRDGEKLHAVLLDWQMPTMTGIDLLRWMKEQPQLEHLPVIMETASGSPEQVREGIEAGAFYYLVKPFDQDLLLSIVASAVTDLDFKRSLLSRLKESENPFGLLAQGTFHFRTLPEAERLSLWIAQACPTPSSAMEISELLINAVEHGTLGITYEEKTAHVADGTWTAEVERRLNLPENTGKHSTVRIDRHPDRMEVLIEDPGPGFDFGRYLVMDETRAFHNHGRGIAIANCSLQLHYLGNGNRVRVTIPFN